MIRNVRLEDQAVFTESYIQAYKNLNDYKYINYKDIKRYFKWLYKRDKNGFFVAEVDRKIAGFAAGDANWIDNSGRNVLEIHEIFVLPEFKGKGIGSKLLNTVLEYGKRQGRKIAGLWVGEHNFEAFNFYKAHGFEKVGKQGKWIRMIKYLHSLKSLLK